MKRTPQYTCKVTYCQILDSILCQKLNILFSVPILVRGLIIMCSDLMVRKTD
jgi:hypothetical protein